MQVNLGPNGAQNKCGDHAYARVYGNNCYELGDIGDGNYFGYCTGPYGANNTAEGIVERDGTGPLGVTLGLPDFGSSKFQGIGATERNLGYQGFPNLWHDYFNGYWNGGYTHKTGSIVYDGNDWPYDDYAVNWLSVCGGNSTCV